LFQLFQGCSLSLPTSTDFLQLADFWQAYKTVIPHERYRCVGKESGQTNHVERLNNTNRAADCSTGKSKFIILQKAQQLHWSDLVLYSWLQCRASSRNLSLTTTSISLPRCQLRAERSIQSEKV
jgi:hypothetical protein